MVMEIGKRLIAKAVSTIIENDGACDAPLIIPDTPYYIFTEEHTGRFQAHGTFEHQGKKYYLGPVLQNKTAS